MNTESKIFSRFDLTVKRTMSPATLTFSSVQLLIRDFERHTPQDRIVCAYFSAYPNMPLIIKSVGFTEPDLILFCCQTTSAVEINVVPALTGIFGNTEFTPQQTEKLINAIVAALVAYDKINPSSRSK